MFGLHDHTRGGSVGAKEGLSEYMYNLISSFDLRIIVEAFKVIVGFILSVGFTCACLPVNSVLIHRLYTEHHGHNMLFYWLYPFLVYKVGQETGLEFFNPHDT